MDIEAIKNELWSVFDRAGICLERDKISTVDLREYITDSLQFISLVLQIEENFDIELPDEILLFDQVISFNALAQTIYSLIQDSDSKEEL